MAIRISLTLIFLRVINSLPTVLAETKYPENSQQCVFLQITHQYYGLYVEDVNFNETSPKNFHGICDLTTLSKWKPCPFENAYPICHPKGCKIQQKICDRRILPMQTPCNCSGCLNSRHLERLPDFPTCFLGEPCVNCIHESRRNARSAPAINNCTRCMTKHPKAGMVRVGSLDLRVKRAEITPPIRRFQTIKGRKLLGCRHSRDGSYSFKWKYRHYVPEKERNRQFRVRRATNRKVFNSQTDHYGIFKATIFNLSQYSERILPKHSYIKKNSGERRLERNSNIAIIRILRRIARSHNIGKRQDDDDDDDDDDDSVDNIGEDIAIEEDDNTEMPISTTETPEKDEFRQEQHKELANHNLTENFNEDEETKTSNHSHSRGFSYPNSGSLISLCCLLVINFWLRKI